MSNEPDHTNPQDYEAQIAAVLETNEKEQARVRSLLADLQERLAGLQHDHKLLSEVRGTKAGSPVTPVKKPAGVPVSEAKSASSWPEATSGKAAVLQAVPQPRGKKAKTTGGTPRGRQQSKAASPQSKPRRAAKPQKAAAKKTGPALRELVQGLLTNEPQTVKELVTALAKAHPERDVTNPQLVRNALNTLISKSLAERTEQGSTVFYTAPETDTAAVSVPGPAAESAPAEETVSG